MGACGAKQTENDSRHVEPKTDVAEEDPIVKKIKASLTDEFTLDQIKELNKNEEKLVIVLFDNLVMDVQGFKESHPGGDDILDDLRSDPTGGMDDFMSVMHSSDALESMKDYCIGLLVDEKKSTPDAEAAAAEPEPAAEAGAEPAAEEKENDATEKDATEKDATE